MGGGLVIIPPHTWCGVVPVLSLVTASASAPAAAAEVAAVHAESEVDAALFLFCIR
jgi:hypothetical protein